MKIALRLVLASCTLLSIIGSSPQAQAQATQFRGYAEVEDVLRQKLSPRGTPFSLYRYVGYERGLLNLLGTWTQFGGEHTFINGIPNSVNMLIWYGTLSGVAQDLGRHCAGNSPLQITPELAKTMSAICAWPEENAKTEQVMMTYWLAVMGYTAPEEEYLAWREFFLNSSFKNRPAAEVIPAMTLAILMNPFFLLQN